MPRLSLARVLVVLVLLWGGLPAPTAFLPRAAAFAQGAAGAGDCAGAPCPQHPTLRVPASRTGPIVAAGASVALTGTGVLLAGGAALRRRSRLSRRRS